MSFGRASSSRPQPQRRLAKPFGPSRADFSLAIVASCFWRLGWLTESAAVAAQKTALQVAWGEGIVKIGEVYSAGGDYKAAAKAHIEKFYAYGDSEVLFKPTLASADQFRGTFDEALSYFVVGSIAEDGGFAIAPYTNVRWENDGPLVDGDTALAWETTSSPKPTALKSRQNIRSVLRNSTAQTRKSSFNHSSLPYSPNKSGASLKRDPLGVYLGVFL